MKILTELTQDYKSTYQVVNEDGTTFEFLLEFVTQQRKWIYGITYGTFIINGSALVVSPNILHQYRNVIPFGIAVSSTDGQDPFLLNDFVSGRVIVAILTKDEVAQQQQVGDFYGGSA